MFGRSKRCETHDQPSPMKIAKLEESTGVNPDAVAELIHDPDSYGGFTAVFADPDLIDCGNEQCRKRRGH